MLNVDCVLVLSLLSSPIIVTGRKLSSGITTGDAASLAVASAVLAGLIVVALRMIAHFVRLFRSE